MRRNLGFAALLVVPAGLDLSPGLAVDAVAAAEGRHGVAARAALDAVALPGLATEKHEGDAGEDAGEQAVEGAGLAEVLRVPVDQAGGAESTAATWKWKLA